jgi:ATP-dependent RNA circularization protein (DNA/RNA ligase family)
METIKQHKPLGQKSYGSIPHLIGSRVGPSDHHAEIGQCRIATEKPRDKHDLVIVQEKLDGGNVGVAKLNGQILAVTRAGYLALTSPYKTHHAFEKYVRKNERRFDLLLSEGERVCGEWMLTAVGTKYNLPHEPFVPFDIMVGTERLLFSEVSKRLRLCDFTMPQTLSIGQPLPIETALILCETSAHGAMEEVEGAIWRVERKGKVDFLCKFVKPTKIDGKYLDAEYINQMPIEFDYLKIS